MADHVGRLIALHESSPEVRDAVVAALGTVAPESPEAAGFLRRELTRVADTPPPPLTSEERMSRRAVADAVSLMGVAARPMLDVVTRLASSADGLDRIGACSALAARRSPEANEVLRRVADEDTTGMWMTALGGIGRAGVTDEATLRFLAEGVASTSGRKLSHFIAAVEALGASSPELIAALDAVRRGKHRASADDARRALRVLGAMPG